MGNQVGSLSEREAYVAFNLLDKVGSVKVAGLVAAAGSVAAAFEAYPNKVTRSGGKLDWEREFSLAKKYGVEIVTPVDAAYPPRLLEQTSHPLALYVKGDASVLSSPSVAIVGTRRATAYGLDQSFKIARGLAESGWTVLSGLALGIDAESHRGALDAGGELRYALQRGGVAKLVKRRIVFGNFSFDHRQESFGKRFRFFCRLSFDEANHQRRGRLRNRAADACERRVLDDAVPDAKLQRNLVAAARIPSFQHGGGRIEMAAMFCAPAFLGNQLSVYIFNSQCA